MRKRTTFDKVGYAVAALIWVAFIGLAIPDGAAAIGAAVAYALFSTLLFMAIWMVVGRFANRKT